MTERSSTSTDREPAVSTGLLLIDVVNPLDFPEAEALAPRALAAACVI